MSKKKEEVPSIETFAEEEELAQYKENQDLVRTLRTVRSELNEKSSRLEEVNERLELYEKLDNARVEPEWLSAPKEPSKAHKGIINLALGDVHWSERVFPEQIGGVNAYDQDIAIKRLNRTVERAIIIARDYWKGVEYEGIVVSLTGDNLAGNIHDELRETNQELILPSVLSLVEVYVPVLTLLAEELGPLHIEAVVGNHGRNTLKPRKKFKARDNFDWLVYQLIAKELGDKTDISVNVSESPDAHYSIYNTEFCLSHGDQFRYGHGISAALSPLMLGKHRKGQRDRSVGQSWDYLVMGHFHHSYWLPGIVVSGSVVGYNEHAFDRNFEYEEPQSVMWLTTPERGITSRAPVFASDRKTEGW